MQGQVSRVSEAACQQRSPGGDENDDGEAGVDHTIGGGFLLTHVGVN